MNPALMDAAMLREPAPFHASQGLALLGAIGLHVGLGAAVLLNSWTPTFEAPSNAQILRTQLVSLPLPVEPQALPEAPVESPAAAAPEPAAEPAAPTEAELAFRRTEQKRVAEAARQQQLRQQREIAERERQAREREQQRLAQEAERTAEARRRIEAERARVATDRQYLPIAKAPPVYPQRALDSGVQGECTVSYDVDPNGRVVSPQVAGQCHPLFIRPSLEAAKRFRYRPRIVDGQAVTVRGVQNTFHYRIE